nr:hypothetical protein [Desulfobacterales bacterium]
MHKRSDPQLCLRCNLIADRYVLVSLHRVQKVLVVEELEPHIEDELRNLAHKKGITVPILGRSARMRSPLYEYDGGMVGQAIADVFKFNYTPHKAISIPEGQKRGAATCIPP